MEDIKLKTVTADNIFQISAILDKMDVDFSKINFNYSQKKEPEMTEKELKEYAAEKFKLLASILNIIIKKIHLAKNEINELLASLTGLTTIEIKKLSAVKYIKLLSQLKDDEEIVGFFKLQGK